METVGLQCRGKLGGSPSRFLGTSFGWTAEGVPSWQGLLRLGDRETEAPSVDSVRSLVCSPLIPGPGPAVTTGSVQAPMAL